MLHLLLPQGNTQLPQASASPWLGGFREAAWWFLLCKYKEFCRGPSLPTARCALRSNETLISVVLECSFYS